MSFLPKSQGVLRRSSRNLPSYLFHIGHQAEPSRLDAESFFTQWQIASVQLV